MAATGYLLTAFLIWAFVVAMGVASQEGDHAPRLPRSRSKRMTLRRGTRRSHSAPAGMQVPSPFGMTSPRPEELAIFSP